MELKLRITDTLTKEVYNLTVSNYNNGSEFIELTRISSKLRKLLVKNNLLDYNYFYKANRKKIVEVDKFQTFNNLVDYLDANNERYKVVYTDYSFTTSEMDLYNFISIEDFEKYSESEMKKIEQWFNSVDIFENKLSDILYFCYGMDEKEKQLRIKDFIQDIRDLICYEKWSIYRDNRILETIREQIYSEMDEMEQEILSA